MYSSENNSFISAESHPYINAVRIEQYNIVAKRIGQLQSQKSLIESDIQKQRDFWSFMFMGLGLIAVVLICFLLLPASWSIAAKICIATLGSGFVMGLVGDLVDENYYPANPRLDAIRQILKENIEYRDSENRVFDDLKMKQAQYWLSMSGHLFEKEVAKLYEAHGYKSEVTKGSGDGGIDIFLEKDGIRYGVQCKNYHGMVGPAAIRELYGTMLHEKLEAGIFIASSGFTKGAREFANNKPIKLLDINDVLQMHSTTLNLSDR